MRGALQRSGQGEAPQSIECGVFVCIAVCRRVHGHVGEGVQRSSAADEHLADTHDLRGDIADAVNAEEFAVRSRKNQLEQSAASGDGSPWGKAEISAPDFVVELAVAALLFG